MSDATPVQHPLSLFMKIAPGTDMNTVGQLLAQYQTQLGDALNSIHTVHFARFMLLNIDNAPTLALFTEYDGDFNTYVLDFVAQLGPIFDALLAHVADPPPTPVADHPDEFVTWVDQHNPKPLTFYSAYPTLTVVDILTKNS
jgi:hypothetical protein